MDSIRSDHASLVCGDIIRLVEGDVVPADCCVMSLGMEHVDATRVVDVGTSDYREGDGAAGDIVTVDSHFITGETKPRQIVADGPDGAIRLTTLYFGSRVLEGTCIALVTATGSRCLLARLIKEGRWPPNGDMSGEIGVILGEGADNDDLEAGIALLPRSS